jgi:4-amino-4-deoxychorismate lyase
MCLFESIRITNNEVPLLEYHQERVDRSIREFLKTNTSISLNDCLKSRPRTGLYKARLTYSSKKHQVTYIPYIPKVIKRVGLFIIDKNVQYNYKLEDRSFLNGTEQFMTRFEDLLLVQNNLLTDSTYCNLALEKNGIWYTPKNPLLKGTERQRQLDNGKLNIEDIYIDEIQYFNHLKLFNAMNPFEVTPELPVNIISTRNLFTNTLDNQKN